MKILVLSDLHTEFTSQFWELPEELPAFDVCVLAGDIAGSPKQAVEWAAERFKEPTIVLPGNHEFYGRTIETAMEEGRKYAETIPNVHLLDRNSVVIDGVRFVGAILWTDYKLLGNQPLAMVDAARGLNDHVRIETRMLGRGSVRFMPSNALERHEEDRIYLRSELARPFDGKTVVVTHHAPHPGSVAERFRNDKISPCFVSDLSGIILDYQPALWIHGHTHDNFDYTVGATRIVCNPKGYGPRKPGAPLENPNFSMKVVEV